MRCSARASKLVSGCHLACGHHRQATQKRNAASQLQAISKRKWSRAQCEDRQGLQTRVRLLSPLDSLPDLAVRQTVSVQLRTANRRRRDQPSNILVGGSSRHGDHTDYLPITQQRPSSNSKNDVLSRTAVGDIEPIMARSQALNLVLHTSSKYRAIRLQRRGLRLDQCPSRLDPVRLISNPLHASPNRSLLHRC